MNNNINNNKVELKDNQRLISVSYTTFQELLDRTEYIREKLKESMSEDHAIISEYISQTEDKCYLNFIIEPKYTM